MLTRESGPDRSAKESTMSSKVNAQQGWPSSRIGGGLVASRRGLALAGLMLAGVGLWVALAFAVTFVGAAASGCS